MITLKTYQIQQSSIMNIYLDRDSLLFDPEYQRQSDVWTLEKRQLLIDSVLNRYDIPKFYFHEFRQPKEIDGKKYLSAIIDGKQRLQAMWDFIEGKFPLSEDFIYFEDDNVLAAKLTYDELSKKYPKLKAKYDGYSLTIIAVQTEEPEMIEDMFTRLNEAVPLSAPEKRNSFGGPLPPVIRRISSHKFFTDKIPFSNKRYRHFDLSAKFLFIEHKNGVAETKKIHLDKFVKDYKKKRSKTDVADLLNQAKGTLDSMTGVFIDKDPLLRSVGMITLYYYLYRNAKDCGWSTMPNRSLLQSFEDKRLKNREAAKQNLEKAEYNLLEFDRLTQSPNDFSANSLRLIILVTYVHKQLKIKESMFSLELRNYFESLIKAIRQ